MNLTKKYAALAFCIFWASTLLFAGTSAPLKKQGAALIPVKRVAQPVVQVTTPPSSLGLNGFYKKYIDAKGIPIISSHKVSDRALLQARSIVLKMAIKLPGRVLSAMINNKVKVGIMGALGTAHQELTTDMPEHRDLTPASYWNARARGLGWTAARPLCSAAEENLLRLNNDRYRGENILIHEFGHTILDAGILKVNPLFFSRLQIAYNKAKAKGLWKNTYAITNVSEYWAEGVQSWFDANKEGPAAGDSVHNNINTRRELVTYDPELAGLIAEYFR